MKKILLALIFVLIISGSICFAADIEVEVCEDSAGMYFCEVEEVADLQLSQSGTDIGLVSGMPASSDADDGFVSVTPAEYYGYNTLLAEDNKNGNTKLTSAYMYFYQKISTKTQTFDISACKLTADNLYKVYFAFLNDFPQIFYLDSGYMYMPTTPYVSTISPYYVPDLTLSDNGAEFDSWAEKIITVAGVRPDMSDYDKAIMLHDELLSRITYNTAAETEYNEAFLIEDEAEQEEKLAELKLKYPKIHSAYGALVEGDAVCDGYAKAYQYLLYKVGIKAHLATGTTNSGGHAWNLVQLDGDWYYTDPTWDDTESEVFYPYFNMTLAQSRASSHYLQNPYEMPDATATQNNYFVKNNAQAESPTVELLAKQLDDGVYVRLYVTGDMQAAKNWLLCEVDGKNTYENVNLVADAAGLEGYIGARIYTKGREICIAYVCDRIEVCKNMAVVIASNTKRDLQMVQAFYDENGVFLKAGASTFVGVANSKIKFNASGDLSSFKTVKYFVWDTGGNLKPLYAPGLVEY